METVVAGTHATSGTRRIFHRLTDGAIKAPGIWLGHSGYLSVAENPEIFVVNARTKNVTPPRQRLTTGVPTLFLGALPRRGDLPC